MWLGACSDEARVVEGDVLINNDYSLESVAGVVEITGSLTIADTDEGTDVLREIALPVLVEIGGDLTVDSNEGLTLLELPGLASVGGNLRLHDNERPMVVEAPRLTTVGGDLEVISDPLGTIEWPSLETIGGSLVLASGALRYANALEGVVLPSLTSIEGEIFVDDNPLLTVLALDDLAALGADLHVVDNELLPTCDAEELAQRLTAAGWSGEASIERNASCN